VGKGGTRKVVAVRVKDNGGSYDWGMAIVKTDSTIALYVDPNGTAFTASWTKAIATTNIAYSLI